MVKELEGFNGDLVEVKDIELLRGYL